MTGEFERLIVPPGRDETPEGLGTVRFLVTCPGNALQVLATAKAALATALKLSESGIFDVDIWKRELPREFVLNSGVHPTLQELEHLMNRPLEQRVKDQEDRRWSVEMFMNAFSPELNMRHWKWWDAQVLDENRIAVAVEVFEWPFPWQSLRWLFIGSGAIDVVPEQ